MVYMLSMRRSGHHAVLNWIMGQLPEPQVHCNNNSLSNPRFGKHLREARSASINFEDAQAREFTDVLRLRSGEFWTRQQRAFGPVKRHIFVLALRDPYNLMASRVMHPKFRKQTVQRPGFFLRQWQEHARFFLGNPPFTGLVAVNYNRWFADESYRRELAAQMDVTFSDARLQIVPRRAGGSSFDGTGYDRKAQQMNVLRRWEQLSELTPSCAAAFRVVLRDSELRVMSQRIFGMEVKEDEIPWSSVTRTSLS